MIKKIAVVGGGLAGLYFVNKLQDIMASELFENIEITIFEKNNEFGDKIKCAQGLSLRWFKKYVPNYEQYVINYVSTFEINSAYHHISDFSKEGEGAIINRQKFEYDLGQKLDHRVIIKKSEYVQSVVKTLDGFSLLSSKEKYQFDFIVAADGVESRIAKSLDLFKSYKLDEIDVSAFRIIKHKDVKEKLLKFYLGKEIAPGGYLWVFPQGGDVANVGIGIDGKSAIKKSPVEYLNEYFEKNYIGCDILEEHVGGIPTPSFRYPIVSENFMTIGDAGFGVNPISRAGIIEALSMANIAAETVADGLKYDKIKIKDLKKYQKKWAKLKGKYYPYLFRLKKITGNLDDELMMSYKDIIESIPESKRTMWKVLRMYLLKNPLLLWKIKSFWM